MSRPVPIRDQPPGSSRIHPVADAYLVWRLCKIVLRRITGLPTDAPLLTTLFTIGVLAHALGSVARSALRPFVPKRPSLGSAVMAAAVAREVPGSLGGSHTRGVPFAGSMIAVSLLAPALRLFQVVTAPMRRLAVASATIVRRYGL